MASKKVTAENISFDESDKEEIIENLFKRVDNVKRRAKIVALANTLSDDGEDEKAYYSTIYHYSLRENWPVLEIDFDEFVGGGLMDPADYVYKTGRAQRSSKKPKGK